MDSKFVKAKEKLTKYNQEHLLNWYEEIEESKKEELLDKVLDIDFELLNNIYLNKDKKVDMENNHIEPIKSIDLKSMPQEELNKYILLGEKAICNNEYAVVTMAGGQRNKVRPPRTKRYI